MNMIARAAIAAGMVFAAALSAPLAEAQTSAPMELNIGLANADPVHLLQYVIEAKGFAKDENLKASWVLFNSGGAAAQALTAGAVDVTQGSIFEVIDSYIAARDLKAFWNVSNLPGYSWYGPKDAASLKQFAGKGRVGVSSIASMTYTLSHWAIAKSGFNADKDFQYIAIGGPLERVAAMQSGQVDLVPVTPPGSFLLAEQGYKPLLDLKDVMPNFEYELVYARPKTLQDPQKAEAIKAWLRATLHAKAWAAAHPDETTDILMKNLGGKAEDRAAYARTVKEVLPYFPDDGEFARDSIKVFLQFKQDEGKLKEIPPVSALTDDRFIAYFKQHPVKTR